MITVALCATLAATLLTSQSSTADPAKAFDFWVGKWTMKGKSRIAPGKAEFTDTQCKNNITRIQGGKVIHENFSMTGFTGESWSVFNPNAKVWTQTWVDSSGSYLLFRGGPEGDKVILHQTNIPATAGFKNRMVFEAIKKDSFDWLWQRSTDNGKTWETQWNLDYKRVKA